MNFYEYTFVVRQDATQNEVQKLVEKFSTIVTEQSGEVVAVEYWGLRSLAYKIKKSRKGHYVMLVLKANLPILNELKRQMQISEDIIRSLVIRIESAPTGPSVMLKNNSEAGKESTPRPRAKTA